MRILGVLILILYLIILLTGIYCTFAANVTEPPEPQPVSANNWTQESSESNTSVSPNNPGSVFGNFMFFPYPVIAPNNAFGQMIRNFFRNNTLGVGWIPLPLLTSMMNSTKSVVPPVDYPLAPEYLGGSPGTTTVSSNPSTSTSPSDLVNPNNGSTVSTNSSTI